MTEELEVIYSDRVFYVDIFWTIDYGSSSGGFIFRVIKIDEALADGKFGPPCPILTQPDLAEITKLARTAFDDEMERRFEHGKD